MKTITFFSYKGGAGRSSTTLNFAAQYAKKIKPTAQNPILLIDMDIDSAGITYLLDADTRVVKKQSSIERILNGEIKFDGQKKRDELLREDTEIAFSSKQLEQLLDSSLSKEFKEHIRDNRFRPGIINGIGEMLNEKSTKADMITYLNGSKTVQELEYRMDQYDNGLAFIDISYKLGYHVPGSILFLGVDPRGEYFYNRNSAKEASIMRLFLDFCEKEKHIHTVICDSPCGRQTVAEILRENTDILICCLRMTKQFRRGTKSFISEINTDEDAGLFDLVILPVAVPEDDPDRKRRALDSFRMDIEDIFRSEPGYLSKEKVHLDMLEYGGINEVMSFKWEERILVADNREAYPGNEQDAIDAYGELGNLVIKIS